MNSSAPSGDGGREPGSRRDQLRSNLSAVRARITAACRWADRPSDSVRLVVVTKTRPVEDCALLVELGVRDLGENRDQEARPKAAELAELVADRPGGGQNRIDWHFVGQLQRNKAGSVARYASYVHSVDSPRLAAALGTAALRHGRRLGCFVQTSLAEGAEGAAAGRGGVVAADLKTVCAAVAEQDALDLVGIMAVPPLGADPRQAYAELMRRHEAVQEVFPEAAWLSAGMSGDLEHAVRAGATHVRVGQAVLGARPNVR